MDGSTSNSKPTPSMLERKARPQKDQALNCPRCNSTNTKFCYYNNYSLSQSQPPSSITKNIIINPDLATTQNNFPQSASQNPKIHQGQDLNLAYPPQTTEDNYNTISKFIELPYTTDHQDKTTSAMELLKTASSSRGLNSFMPMTLSESSAMYNSSGFALQDFKLGVNFGLEGFENGYGGLQGINNQEGSAGGGGGGGARMLFPVVEDQLNKQQQQQVPNSGEFEHQQNRTQGDSTGYWNGMLGGGSW
uniref:Dof-type domain-containing protein n=1 Tax=Medicago truncatula TaxID=3880 RepID=I3SED2_MEDTR|nr:unknown [Medicago truncatula]